MHSLDLLLSLGTSVVQSLILLFNELELALNLLHPSVMVGLLSLLVLSFEFPDFLKLSLFLNFKDGLLTTLAEKHIKNWLYFSIEIEEVIVADFSISVDACLLWNVLWRWWFWKEFISLALHIHLDWLLSVLLSEEKCEIDLNTGLREWFKVIDTGVRLLFFEF